MKNFRIRVNGNVYDVEVEELAAGSIPQPPVVLNTQPIAPMPVPVASTVSAAPIPAPVAPTPALAPALIPVASAPVPAATTSVGGHSIESPMPGTILDVKVSVGDSVKVNQVIAVLEAMKMENEIVTSAAGKVTSVNVVKGESIETGAVIVKIAVE